MNLQHARTLIALLLIIASTLASAQIYKTTDEHGNTQYTDNPGPNAAESTEVEVAPVNTVTPIDARPAAPATTAEEKNTAYATLAIASPANESIIPNLLVPTKVSASISPSLKEGHEIRLRVNGNVISTGTSNNFIIPTLNIGTNTLQLEVVEGDTVLQRSSAITLFAYRPGS